MTDDPSVASKTTKATPKKLGVDGASGYDRFAWPVTALSFGMAQPVLDLLGRSPAFFGARNSPPSDLVLTGVALAVVIPALAGGLSFLPGRLGRGASFLATGVGLFSFGVQIPQLVGVASVIAWAVAGILAVLVGTWLFDNADGFRSAVKLLSLSPLIFLGTFLFASPTGDLIQTRAVELLPVTRVERPVPLVVVVFDELPVASLMTPSGEIRSEWFPNFSRLADDAVWFRNAATVQQQTEHALPALLSGLNPPQTANPILADHPNNLFTLLRESHHIRAVEALTSLCDAHCDPIIDPPSPFERWRALGSDIGVATGHRLLPPSVKDRLPSIEDTWADFGLIRFEDRIKSDRGLTIQKFNDAVTTSESDGKPPLYFLHVLLPHRPWEHLPDGRLIGHADLDPPGVILGTWIEEWPVALSLQQHVLEAQFTDSMLGTVLDTLEASGLYDDAMIVVTADHGISIRTGVRYLRSIEASNIGDIGAIPLFVKLPGGARAGTIDDYRAESVDILPTIADVLDVDVAWPTDGASLIAPVRPTRTETVTTGPVAEITWGVTGNEKYEMVSAIETLFRENDPFRLVLPEDEGWLGSPTSGFQPCAACRLDNAAAFEDVVPEAPVVMNVVAGTIAEGGSSRMRLGIGVNGTVEAVTYPFREDDGSLVFEAMFDPALLREGGNNIEVLILD